MELSLRIAAIFATMDRPETAAACVSALATQTRPPQWVIVADNDPDGSTAIMLGAMVDLPFELTVLRMEKNIGNAGGVEAAMEEAFTAGADAVWILDDDSWPRKNALESMLSLPWDPNVVRHPLQIDPKSGRFTWPMFVSAGPGKWRLAASESELPDGEAITSRISWTGALVSRQIRQEVGPVNGALFIRGEDEEYPWRIEQAGFTFLAVRAAVLDHPGPNHVTHWKLMGKNFFFERGLADWKLYYKVRNMVWLKRRQAGNFKAIRMALSYFIAATVLEGPSRWRLLCRAARDGWAGKLGKMPDFT